MAKTANRRNEILKIPLILILTKARGRLPLLALDGGKARMSAPRRKRNSAGGTPALPEREPAAKSGE